MRITKKKLDKFYKNTCKGNLIQSTRRLIFTHCTTPTESSGFYYADNVYCLGGTGILIKYNQKFFILTAQHVIDANYIEPQNESPFFTHLLSNKSFDGHKISQLGFPMRGWRIGELIHAEFDHVDREDLVLIELSSFILIHPDRYIDFDNKNHPKGINPKHLTYGIILVASGYPIDANPIDYHNDSEYNCTTTLHRHVLPGKCEIHNNQPVLRLQQELSSTQINGMSGGLVSNISNKANSTEWVGLIQKGGGGIIRFYPAFFIIPAIKRYNESTHYVIDPAANLINDLAENSPEGLSSRKLIYEIARKNLF